MPRRLVALAAAALLATPLLASAGSADASSGTPATLKVTRWFSPNGDGVKDTALVRFELDEPAKRITLTFRTGYTGYYDNVKRVVLKDLDAGIHTWTWDGRDGKHRIVDDARFKVTLQGDVGVSASATTQVDTVFAPDVRVVSTYSAPEGRTPSVWPRSTDVTDAIGLMAALNQRYPIIGAPVRDARLEIRDRSGRLVLLRDVNRKILNDKGRIVDWTATRNGAPLPQGRYAARVIGGDRVGNRGRSAPLRIWVSGDRLEWQERTEVVTPVDSRANDYCTSSGCGDFQPCGSVVPSARYAGGLSYRSVECTGPFRYSVATRLHGLEVPDAAGVRGIESASVGFTGAPTTDGETDQGRLFVSTFGPPYGLVTSSTGATTAMVGNLSGANGEIVEDYTDDVIIVPPRILWSFSTRGSDSVDVGRFTVTYRLLVPVRS